MTVLLSHGGRNFYPTSGPDGELGVATVNGIVWAAQQGGQWAIARRTLQGKHISGIIQTPDGTLFAGTHKGGLWASADGGDTWEQRQNGIYSPDFYALNWHELPGGGVRVFAGTEPAHLYFSDDLGHTWSELPGLIAAATTTRWTFPAPPHVAHVKHINFDPRSNDTLYVAVEQGGLYKSTDAGQTFTELSGFDDDVHRVVMSPMEPDHLYITTGIGAYHSTDAGQNWERLTNRESRIGYPDAVIPHPTNLHHYFVGGAKYNPGQWRTNHDADATVTITRDGGKTWDVMASGLPAHLVGNVEALAMNAWDGGFALFAGTTDGAVYTSADEGASWTAVVEGVAPVSKGGHYFNLNEKPELVAAR